MNGPRCHGGVWKGVWRGALGAMVACVLAAPEIAGAGAPPGPPPKKKDKPAATDAITQMITKAYKEILGRAPDEEGLTNYRRHVLEDGWDEEDVRKELVKSTEYRARIADDIIIRAYKEILGRAPDKEGLATYRQLFIEEGWSEERVRGAMKRSLESKSKPR